MFSESIRQRFNTGIFITKAFLCLVILICSIFSENIFAQNNPFGAPPAQPAGANPAAPGGNVAADPLAGENNLIIRQLLIEDPNTPLELADAIRLSVQLGRTDIARQFIKKFDALMPSPKECSDIQRSLNSAFLYEIATHAKLQPDGDRFVATIRSGAIEYLRDDARVARLILDLGSDDSFVRRRATTELRASNINAAVALGIALGDPVHEDYYPAIETALVGMGDVAVEPTIGFLGVDDLDHKARIISALGRLGAIRIADRIVALTINEPADSHVGAAARKAITRIVGVLPSLAVAAQFLKQQFGRYLEGDLMLPQDRQGRLLLGCMIVNKER